MLIDVLRFTIYDYPVIPLHLKLSGFLSYRDPVEVDFSSFDLACISGSNGAGKSSLLDAITWALFGQARKRDEAVINLQSKAAEVSFTFAYETNIYRVLRSLTRGKTTTLEFQIAEGGNLQSSIRSNQQLTWRPLTERTLRDTQARIEHILRLDYDTFVNVSFFLQGRADQFAQQPPTRRKEILGAILGLEAWDIYRERAAEHRKAVERELDSVDGRVAEIDAELAEEEPRKAHLAELESQLKGLAASRKLQETALANVKQVRQALDRQRELVRKLAETLARSQANLAGLQARLAVKEIRAQHACGAGAARRRSGSCLCEPAKGPPRPGKVGAGGRALPRTRPAPPAVVARDRERKAPGCSRKRPGWKQQRSAISDQLASSAALEAGLAAAQAGAGAGRRRSGRTRSNWKSRPRLGVKNWPSCAPKTINLKTAMDELKSRIEKLGAAQGVLCPLCGQSLSPEHRQSTLEQLNAEGTQLGDRWRANKSAMDELAAQINEYRIQITNIASADTDRLNASNSIAQLSERLESLQKQSSEWEQAGAKRLEEVTQIA